MVVAWTCPVVLFCLLPGLYAALYTAYALALLVWKYRDASIGGH